MTLSDLEANSYFVAPTDWIGDLSNSYTLSCDSFAKWMRSVKVTSICRSISIPFFPPQSGAPLYFSFTHGLFVQHFLLRTNRCREYTPTYQHKTIDSSTILLFWFALVYQCLTVLRCSLVQLQLLIIILQGARCLVIWYLMRLTACNET